jgi:hypothetical protein
MLVEKSENSSNAPGCPQPSIRNVQLIFKHSQVVFVSGSAEILPIKHILPFYPKSNAVSRNGMWKIIFPKFHPTMKYIK